MSDKLDKHEGACNPFLAPCGARFCTYEEMAEHVRECKAEAPPETGHTAEMRRNAMTGLPWSALELFLLNEAATRNEPQFQDAAGQLNSGQVEVLRLQAEVQRLTDDLRVVRAGAEATTRELMHERQQKQQARAQTWAEAVAVVEHYRGVVKRPDEVVNGHAILAVFDALLAAFRARQEDR